MPQVLPPHLSHPAYIIFDPFKNLEKTNPPLYPKEAGGFVLLMETTTDVFFLIYSYSFATADEMVCIHSCTHFLTHPQSSDGGAGQMIIFERYTAVEPADLRNSFYLPTSQTARQSIRWKTGGRC